MLTPAPCVWTGAHILVAIIDRGLLHSPSVGVGPVPLACSKGDSRTEMREKRPGRQQNLPLLEVIEITVITLIASQCFSMPIVYYRNVAVIVQ